MPAGPHNPAGRAGPARRHPIDNRPPEPLPAMIAPRSAMPIDDEAWCTARTAEVAAHVQALGLAHGRIGDGPAWHAAPYAGLWVVERGDRPEWIGWWVICGDLPIDTLPAGGLETPRDALRAFGKRWSAHAESMDRGEVPPAWSTRPLGEIPKLSATLKARGAALVAWADEAGAWPED